MALKAARQLDVVTAADLFSSVEALASFRGIRHADDTTAILCMANSYHCRLLPESLMPKALAEAARFFLMNAEPLVAVECMTKAVTIAPLSLRISLLLQKVVC